MYRSFLFFFLFLFGLSVDAQTGMLRGRVVNVRTHEPLSEAVVQVRGMSYATVTDSLGRYFFRQLPQGTLLPTVGMIVKF